VATNSKSRRVSQSSQNSTRNSATSKPTPRLSQGHPQLSLAEYKAAEYATGVIYRENPDKRGLLEVRPTLQDTKLSTKQEKSMELKAEKEKLEVEKMAKDMAREKVQERVKRANELEQEKEKELAKEEKRRKRRSFFCGLIKK
jgi:hypothetical protein